MRHRFFPSIKQKSCFLRRGIMWYFHIIFFSWSNLTVTHCLSYPVGRSPTTGSLLISCLRTCKTTRAVIGNTPTTARVLEGARPLDGARDFRRKSLASINTAVQAQLNVKIIYFYDSILNKLIQNHKDIYYYYCKY